MSDDVQILVGDCRKSLRTLPKKSVHMCVTSPPYWGLRDYETEHQVWGGDPDCRHRWGNPSTKKFGSPQGTTGQRADRAYTANGSHSHTFCRKCNAWKGELGQEPTPQLFVEHLVEIFRAVRRVLRDDGTLWVNLGDSYASGTIGRNDAGRTAGHGKDIRERSEINADCKHGSHKSKSRKVGIGINPGNLIGVPWRFALAMQDAGWILRQDIIWYKPNPMPESITNRCSKSHEYIFLFAKKEGYFFDNIAIQEPAKTVWNSHKAFVAAGPRKKLPKNEKLQQLLRTRFSHNTHHPDVDQTDRNRRSVWTIPTEPNKDGHFAAYPRKLVRIPILAGTSAKGCCPDCGAPYKRRLKKRRKATRPAIDSKVQSKKNRIRDESGLNSDKSTLASFVGNRDPERHITDVKTIGWKASCECDAGSPVPCIVLDPFGGTGTTAAEALRKNRRAVVCELNPEYVEFIRKKIKRARAQKGFGF